MSIRRYLDWLSREAFPFWLNAAADSDGLFYEALDRAGTPQIGPLRSRTGMRQVFAFAYASQLGLVDATQAVPLAVRMYQAMRDRAWAPDGRAGWIATFGRDGTSIDPRRDLYDHAFAVLALAHLAKVTEDSTYLDHLGETFVAIDLLRAPHGGFFQSDAKELTRSQNPHMHLFEACLGAYENTKDLQHLARAGEIYGLLTTRFIDPNTGLLTEFFGPSWERSTAFRSERLDPGHMMEWTWLLRRYQRLTGQNVGTLTEQLFSHAYKLGRVAGDFVVDEIDWQGNALVDRRRLWPQTEYLKALLVQTEAGASSAIASRKAADALAERISNEYLSDAPRGTWRDQFALSGNCTAQTIPASSLYHLLTAAPEIMRAIGSGE